jgi:hypothetical protein
LIRKERKARYRLEGPFPTSNPDKAPFASSVAIPPKATLPPVKILQGGHLANEAAILPAIASRAGNAFGAMRTGANTNHFACLGMIK